MAEHCDQDSDWNIKPSSSLNGVRSYPIESIQTILLMDLRKELREINHSLRCLRCGNFLRIPQKLDRIGRNTERKKRAPSTAKAKA